MTEDLRSRLRDELDAQRPPPLGDLVARAVRDGRRVRRRRRLTALGGGTAGVVALAAALGVPSAPSAQRDEPAAAPVAGAEQGPPPPPPGPPPGRQLVAATPEGMLVLLGQLLPPGRTSAFGKAGPRELHVQLYLDRGKGPGMIRVSVSGRPRPGPRGGAPVVSVADLPGDCLRSTVVRARWPDGPTVQADLATCLATDGERTTPAPPALSEAEARVLVTDARWGPTMDADLVKAGARQFPQVARFS